jgi:multidrug efflux system outer membrane protein
MEHPMRSLQIRLSRRPLSLLLIGFVTMMLSGCFAVGPDYKTPDLTPPSEWSRSLQGGVTAATPDKQALAQWWNTLGDRTCPI